MNPVAHLPAHPRQPYDSRLHPEQFRRSAAQTHPRVSPSIGTPHKFAKR